MTTDALPSTWTDDELLAFLDEQLPAERSAQLERQLRDDSALRTRLAGLIRQRDHGGQTVGEVWRQFRLSCPSREMLGSYLLGALDSPLESYLDFHLRTIGCRYCGAAVEELTALHQQTPEQQAPVPRRYFESSAGHLRQVHSPHPEGDDPEAGERVSGPD